MNDVSETNASTPIHRLDVRGLWCPEPAVQTKKALQDMAPGEQLEVWSSDPLAPVDLEVLCKRFGHQCLGHDTLGDYTSTTIIKSVSMETGGS